MRLSSDSHLVISDEDYLVDPSQIRELNLSELLESARESSPDLKLASLDEKYYERLFDYENAQRTPDINLKVGYDRGGGKLYKFIVFGVDNELPLINTNQDK